jgi:tetratricopeptide (TPR) repeat protein
MLKQFPNAIELHNLAGAANMGLMQFDTAIGHYTQVLNINPGDAEAHYNMGVAHNGTGDLDAAIASYTQTLSINPNYTQVYNK